MTTRQAVVVSRKMDTPTAVVAMLGIESFGLSSASLWTLGPSEEEGDDILSTDHSNYNCLLLEELMLPHSWQL